VVPHGVEAAVVGRFVLVEGRVDLLKGGKLPLVPAQVQAGLEQGDVVRTKSDSRAQIQFVDETVLTIAPSSRVAIEDYVFDAAKGKRSAVIEIFRGLVQTVVKKIYRMEEPDFVVKTTTAALGVRGTKWYTQILPSATDVYTEEAGEVTQLNYKPSPNAGLEVKNRFPEITGKVVLKAMQFTRVGLELAPTVPVNITKEDLKYLQAQIIPEATGGTSTSRTPESSGTAAPTSEATATTSPETTTPTSTPYSNPAPTGGLSTMPATLTTTPTSVITPTSVTSASNLDSPVQSTASGLYIPPPAPPPPHISPSPEPQTYYFTQTWFGTFVFQSEYPFSQGGVVGWGWGQRTGVYDGYYYATYSHVRYPPSESSFGMTFLPGTVSGTMSGSVTGFLGQTLTGTMTFTGELATGGTFNYSGEVTLQASGYMVYTYSGTRTNPDGSSAGTTVSGVMYLYPGTYFKQTVASFSVRSISYAPYWYATYRNEGPVSGTREGYSPGPFTGSFTTNSYSGRLNDYAPSKTEMGELTMEGVIGGSPGGVQTGAMTVTARGINDDPDPSVLGGPVTAYPNGTLVAEVYSSRSLGSGDYEVEQGIWIQTSDPEATTFTQTFGGNLNPIASSPPYNTGTFSGIGWGYRRDVIPGYYVGTISGTVTGPDGNWEPPQSPDLLSLYLAGVVKQANPEGPWVGEVFATGRAATNALITGHSSPGSITIQLDGTATLNLNNNWIDFQGSGTTTYTLTTTPGTFFDQVAGPGSVTYTSDPPYNQQQFGLLTGSPGADVVLPSAAAVLPGGSGTLGNFQVTNFSGTSQVDPGFTNVFPPSVISPDTMFYSQGVIGPGGTGAMTLTVVDSTGWYRLRGPVNQLSGANLQAPNLVTKMTIGPSRIPMFRSAQYQQQAAPIPQ